MPVSVLNDLAIPLHPGIGPPTTGTHIDGELHADSVGSIFICIGAGTPGSWAAVGGGGGLMPPVTITGSDPATTPLTVIGAPGQTNDLLDLFDSTQSAGLTVSLAAMTYQTGSGLTGNYALDVHQYDAGPLLRLSAGNTSRLSVGPNGGMAIDLTSTDGVHIHSDTDGSEYLRVGGPSASSFAVFGGGAGQAVAIQASNSADSPLLIFSGLGVQVVGVGPHGGVTIQTDSDSTDAPLSIHQPGGAGTALVTVGSSGATTITGADPATTPLSVMGSTGQTAPVFVVTEPTQSAGIFVSADYSIDLLNLDGYGLSVGHDASVAAGNGLLVRVRDAANSVAAFETRAASLIPRTSFLIGNHGQVTVETDSGATEPPLTIHAPGGSGTDLLSLSSTGVLTVAGNIMHPVTTVGTATLAGGTVAVSAPAVTASSKVFVTDQSAGVVANIGTLRVTSKTAGSGFTVTSTNPLDTSNFDWMVVEP